VRAPLDSYPSIVAWKTEDVRAFLDRDWDAFARAPIVLDAPRAAALAGALYAEARAAMAGWPAAADREEDLGAHLRLTEIFSRIYHAEHRRGDPR